MKTATFFPTPCCFGVTRFHRLGVTHCHSTAMRAIERDLDISTTQMCLLNKVKDYDVIRIVEGPDDVIEIVNNHDGTYSCDRTDKEIRRAHNLFKMWESGVFDR